MNKFLTYMLLALVISSPAHSALIKSYDFNGNLSDTLGVGNDLIQNNGGSISNGFFNVGLNTGLKLTDALIDTENYAIEIRMKVTDDLSSWNKLIDFLDLTSDNGFYLFGDDFDFYVNGGQIFPANVNLDEFFTVSFERDAGQITVYLDNVLLGSFVDGSNQAVPTTNVLNFFEDDSVTGKGEAFVGVVDFIRIHSDAQTFGQDPEPVSEPSGLVLMTLCVIALMRSRRRIR
jgi:hypothetical protein